MTWVKICGITNLEDAMEAIHWGADALGFNFYSKSPRFISPIHAMELIKELPDQVIRVAVFVNETEPKVRAIKEQCFINLLQFHGDESFDFCKKFKGEFFKVFRLKKESDLSQIAPFIPLMTKKSRFLLDSKVEGFYGGSGISFNWEWAKKAKSYGEIILSGGLNPENIQDALNQVSPFGVDVCSGVEGKDPRKKDLQKIKKFIQNIRNWDNTNKK